MTRSVLIVGASSGIGRATALRLARGGAKLALVSRSDEALERVSTECRQAGAAAVRSFAADVLDESGIGLAVEDSVTAYGAVDAVVHTATVMGYGSIEDMPSQVFTTVVDTAVHGTLYLARAVLPHFRQRGRGTLIIINSLLGSVTVPNMGAYATAKWGQRAIARTLQQEVQRDRHIKVCIVSPGSTNTPIYYQGANYTGQDARPPVPVLQPERTAASIVGLISHPRKHVSVPVGPPNPVIITGFRLLPFVYDRLVGPLFTLVALTKSRRSRTEGNVRTPTPAGERTSGHWPRR